MKSNTLNNVVLILLLLNGIHSYSQFSLQGSKINGQAAGNESGFSIDLDDEGNTIVIGEPLSTNGHLSVYDFTGGSWIQRGVNLDGEASGDEMGYAVAISDDGNIIAGGAIHNDGGGTSAGNVRIYQWDGSNWIQMGSDINGNIGDLSGNALSLSSDGLTVAIGARENDGNGTESGQTKVFVWNGTTWIQKGSNINGEAAGDFSGYAVSLSDDGNTLAIGAIDNDGNGISSGHTRIFAWDGSLWIQKGSDINGEDAGELSGCSISLSSDGNTIVIGSRNNDDGGTNAGQTRVFTWNGSAWIQKGGDINGEASADFSGYAVSINDDGNIISIGAPDNDAGGTDRGHVRVYFFEGGNWNLAYSQELNGQANADFFGGSVSLNNVGTTLAIGARRQNGGGSDAGASYIYATPYSIAACTTPSATITVRTQTEVNNLLTVTYPGCTDFLGTLRIIDDNDAVDNIIDLTPLLPLRYIGNDLYLSNNQNLNSLTGLDNLHSTFRDLTLLSNPMISDLSGLGSLDKIGFNLNIDNNDLLDNLTGLSSLDTIGRNLNIENNDALTSIDEMTTLDSIGSNFIISNNDILSNLNGLNNLKHVDNNLYIITGNTSLESIDGFNGLTYIGGNLSIKNDNLKTITGFQNLEYVDGFIRIELNTLLEGIAGFDALENLGGKIEIQDNNSLTQISGFNGLSYFSNQLEVIQNAALTDISGFSQLEQSYGLILRGNTNLTNIDGFLNYDTCKASLTITNNGLSGLEGIKNLKAVTLDLLIQNNDFLTELDSLASLSFVGGGLTLNNNDLLSDLDGLQHITSLNGGSLTITNNAILQNVDSLSNINYIDQNLVITNNPMLQLCCGVFNVIDNNMVNGTVIINGNGTGCADETEVINGGACLPPCSIALVSAVESENQVLNCLTTIDEVQYELKGTMGVNISDLPAGLNYTYTNDTVKIYGNPTETGIFNYSLVPDSPCGSFTANGSFSLNGGIVKIGSICYPSLEDALLSVLPGEIIDVNGNINPPNVTIPKNITVSLNALASWTNTAVLKNNGTIILNGGIFQNGNSGVYKGNGVFNGDFYNYGSVSPGN